MTPSHFSGRGCGDTRMWEMYAEYGDIASSEEPPGRIKARLSALSAFAEAQGLTGSAALEGLRRLKTDLNRELMVAARFALFYGFVFFICRERGQKSLAVSTAVEAWHLSMEGRFSLLEQWCGFVQRHQRHAISEDTWRQLLEFSQSVNDDLTNYDPEGAWPVLVDDFVDSMYRKSISNLDQTSLSSREGDLFGSHGTDHFEGAQGLGNLTATVVPSPIRSKRRRSDNRSEVSDLESVNSIVQRLAEMSSPVSYKRLCTAPEETAEDMEVALSTEAAHDMNLEVTEASKEIRPSGNLGLGQAPSLLPWTNMGCTVVAGSNDAGGSKHFKEELVAGVCIVGEHTLAIKWILTKAYDQVPLYEFYSVGCIHTTNRLELCAGHAIAKANGMLSSFPFEAIFTDHTCGCSRGVIMLAADLVKSKAWAKYMHWEMMC